jgi:hypothetical protein
MIEASVEFLRLKAKGFEQSFQAVKKVYDSLSGVNAALVYGIKKEAFTAAPHADPDELVGIGPTPPMTIGKPRY